MALRPQDIPNMIGGVSQQPESLRLPGQLDEDVNSWADPINHWDKRPGSQHVSVLSSAPSGAQAVHWINRDTSERYVVQFGNGTLNVWDLDGVAQTVNSPSGLGYLATSDPANDIRTLTISDYTFVVNRSINADLKAAVVNTPLPEGMVVVNQGSYATRYLVTVKWVEGVTNKTRTVEYTSYHSDGTPPGGGSKSIPIAEQSVQTRRIAKEIGKGLNGTGFDPIKVSVSGDTLHADFSVTQNSSTVLIELDSIATVTDFSIQTDDDVASGNLEAFKDETDDFTRLPTYTKTGFTIKIVPDLVAPEVGGYHVKFRSTDGTNFGDGIWEETPTPGIQYQFDEDTMPHILRRESGGDWTFSPADGSQSPALPSWSERDVGDDITNKVPDFVGNPIENLGFFKDRLVLLSGTSISLSEIGNAFQFWRTSVLDVLDTDRILRDAPYRSIVTLFDLVPREAHLLILGDRAQFVLLSEGEALTPTDAEVSTVSELQLDPLGPSLPLRDSILVPAQRGTTHSLVREFVDISQQRPRYQAPELTAHVPKFIQGRVKNMAAHESQGIVLVSSDIAPEEIYVYQFFDNAQQRVQNSWRTWKFTGTVLGVERYDNFVYVLLQRGSEVSLEKMDFVSSLDPSANGHLFALDRRITHSDTTVSYNSSTDETTLTLPWSNFGSRSLGIFEPSGVRRAVSSVANNSAVVPGDLTGLSLWIGEMFDTYGVLAKPYEYRGEPGSLVANMNPKTKVSRMALRLEDATFLDVHVGASQVAVVDDSSNTTTWDIKNLTPWGYYWAGLNNENIDITVTGGSVDQVDLARDVSGNGRDWTALVNQEPGTLYGQTRGSWTTTLNCLGTDGPPGSSNAQFGNVYTQPESLNATGDFYLGAVIGNLRGGGKRDMWGTTTQDVVELDQGRNRLQLWASGVRYTLTADNAIPNEVGYCVIERKSGIVKVYWNKAEVSFPGGVQVGETFDPSGWGWDQVPGSSDYWDDELFAALMFDRSLSPQEHSNVYELEINPIWNIWPTPPAPPAPPPSQPPVVYGKRWTVRWRGGHIGSGRLIEQISQEDSELRFSVHETSNRTRVEFHNPSPFPTKITGGTVWFTGGR